MVYVSIQTFIHTYVTTHLTNLLGFSNRLAALVSSKLEQKQVTDDSDNETLASRARKIAFSTLNLSASEFEQFVTESEIDKVL